MENTIKEADEIVSHIKEIRTQIDKIRIYDDIDFVGCSGSYMIEKIHMAISSLKWYEKRIRQIHHDRNKDKPKELWAQWDLGLTCDCPYCKEHISILDIEDVWEGNTNIEPIECNKYKTMDFDCPHCEKEVIVTNFTY